MTTTTQPTLGAPKRLIGLDLLRLMAIVLVLGRHMERIPSDWDSPLKPVFEAWWHSGGQGVDLFFVLSGFLVSGLLFAEYKKLGDLSISRFYLRRAWKIYPAFYCLIGFTYIYQKYFVGNKLLAREKWSECLFLQSYIPGYWNHTWTLAVEEHFYLALPLLLLFFVRRNSNRQDPFRAVPYVVASSMAVCLAIRAINFAVREEYSYHTHAFATHLRIDALLFGVAIAYGYHFHTEWFLRALRPWRHALLAGGAILFTAWLFLPYPGAWYGHTLGFMQIYLGAGAIIVGTILCQIPTNRVTRSLAGLGAYSYSIYLWHMAFMRWVVPELTDVLSWQSRTALYFVAAFAIGIAMAKLLELPLLKLRDRKFPSRSEIEMPPTEASRDMLRSSAAA